LEQENDMLTRIMKPRDERDAGFTLIELLVVVVIIGILAAIAIPVFLNQRAGARDASVKSDLNGIAKVMETLYTQNGAYPTTLTVLQTANPVTSSGNLITITNNGTTGYSIVGCNAESTNAFTYNSLTGGLASAPTSTANTCTGATAGVVTVPAFATP